MTPITPEQMRISMLILIPLSLIPATIAKNKGRNFWLWYFYGYGFFIFALLHSLLLQPKNSDRLMSSPVNNIGIIKDRINYFYPDSPIDMLSYVIINDFSIGKIICQLNMFAYKEIEKITINLELKDMLDNFIAKKQFENLNYTSTIEFDLSEYRGIKTVNFEIVSISLKDGSVWTPTSDKTSYQINVVTGDVLKKIKDMSTEHAICLPENAENFWVCTCGKANLGDKCLFCQMEKQKLFSTFTEDTLLELKNEQIRNNNLLGADPSNKQEFRIVNKSESYDANTERKRFLILLGIVLIINIIIFFLI